MNRFFKRIEGITRKILLKGEDAYYKADGAMSMSRYCFFMVGLVLIDFLADKQMMELILLDIGSSFFILFMTLIVSVMLEALPSLFAVHFMKERRTGTDNIVAIVTGAAFLLLIVSITVLRFATIDIVFDDTMLAGSYSRTAKYVITAFLSIVPLITSCFAFGITCAVSPERKRRHQIRIADTALAERHRQLVLEETRLRSIKAQNLLELEDQLYKAEDNKRKALCEKLENLSRLKIAAYLRDPEHLTRMEEGGNVNVQ